MSCKRLFFQTESSDHLGKNSGSKELTKRGVFTNIGFNLKKGKILGFSGLVGGRKE